MTKPPDPADIDKAIAELEAEAAKSESPLAVLAKSVSTTNRMLWGLLNKGKAPPSDDEGGDEPPAPEGGDDEDDDKPQGDQGGSDDDDDGGDGDSAGYRDMMLAREGETSTPPASTEPPNYLDVTEWLIAIQGRLDHVETLAKAVQSSDETIAQLTAQNARLVQMVEAANARADEMHELVKAMATAQIETGNTLAKGVMDLRESLANIPQLPAHLRGIPNRVLPPPEPQPTTFIGGDERLQMRVLAKARSDNLITAGESRFFQQTRGVAFSDDAERNKAIFASIEKIAQQLSSSPSVPA